MAGGGAKALVIAHWPARYCVPDAMTGYRNLSRLPVCLAGSRRLILHQVIELGLPHIVEAKLYLEDGARRIIHVWTDLSADHIAEIAALREALRKLQQDDPLNYDGFWFYLKGSVDAQRP